MEVEKWEVEPIPNNAVLYVRIHEGYVNSKGPEIGLPKEASFYNTPKGTGVDLSSDWNKHATPQSSRQQIGKEYKTGKTVFKDPSQFYIVSFFVQDIIDLNLQQEIEHSPRQENFPEELIGLPWNKAHTSIIGDDEERRLKMVDIAKWEIAPPQYNSDTDARVFSNRLELIAVEPTTTLAAGNTYKGKVVFQGPKGGCYYINANNRKTYIDCSKS